MLHSYMTHFFLLKGEEPSVCIPCDELLTIEPILLACSDFIEAREWYLTLQLGQIFDYLKEISIFGKLYCVHFLGSV